MEKYAHCMCQGLNQFLSPRVTQRADRPLLYSADILSHLQKPLGFYSFQGQDIGQIGPWGWPGLTSPSVLSCQGLSGDALDSATNCPKQRSRRFNSISGERNRLSSSEQAARCPASLCPFSVPKSRGHLPAAFPSPVPAALSSYI